MSAQEQQATEFDEKYEPRVYVACSAAYNNGQLHGRWIEADQKVESIQSDIAAFIAEHGELGGKLLSHFANNLDDAEASFENYAGEYKSLADFAQELTEQTTEIPQSLAYYVNYESMGRDMELGGDIFTIELGFETLHVFWSW